MNNLQNTFLKLLSIVVILFTHLPSQKFSIPYGISILTTLSERISELDFTSDLFVSLLFIVGLPLLFTKSKKLNVAGFIFIIIPLVVFSMGKSIKGFTLLFWIPVVLYLGLTGIILSKRSSKS